MTCCWLISFSFSIKPHEIRLDTHSWLATFPQCQSNLSRLQRAEECPQVYSVTHFHHQQTLRWVFRQISLTKLNHHIEILDEDRQNMWKIHRHGGNSAGKIWFVSLLCEVKYASTQMSKCWREWIIWCWACFLNDLGFGRASINDTYFCVMLYF